MAKLSKSELMALDLMIQLMKDEQMGIQVSEAAFIGGIVKVTKKVVNVTRKITPVLKVTAQITPVIAGGTTARLSAQEQTADEELEADVSLESLIAIREALTRYEDK
jgi:hypothetical protein